MKKRLNIFNQIHKGLRAMLYDCALNLQLADFSNTEEAGTALYQLETVLKIFELHAHSEDKFILPVIEKFNKLLVKEFDGEHEKDEFMTHRLNSLIKVFHNALTDESRIDAGESITKSFNEFIAFNLYHMNKEEEKLNPILWMNYCDDEIRNIQQAIVKSVPQEESAITSQWMLKGNSDAEIIAWLKHVKNNAPCFVLESLMLLAEKVLPAARWSRIQQGLTEGVQLA